ncbi:MAG: DUF58 domain-containing protein [Phycisphaerales bacterium]
MTRASTQPNLVGVARRPTKIDELIDSELMTKLNQLDVVSRKIFLGKLQGERRSKRRGQSVEFADYRNYVPGDDLRYIDWNVYGRLDVLFLKLFLEEEDLSLHIVVDVSKSMDYGDPSKFVFAQRLAMALGYIGLVNYNRVTLAAFGAGLVDRLPNLRGRRKTQDIGQWLLNLEPGDDTDFEPAMKTLALSRQGRGVMVIISDFLFKRGYEKGLRYLQGGGYDTFVIQALSPQEIDPAATGALSGDLKLVDVEDGHEAEVTLSAAVIKRYKENLNAYCGALRDYCVRRSMTHMTLRTDMSMETLLLEYLRKRGLLK